MADSALILGLGGMAALLVIGGVLRRSPRLTIVVWVAVLFFVPVWVGVSIGLYMAAITIITLLAIAVQGRKFRFTGADVAVVIFVSLICVMFGTGDVKLTYFVSALLEWVLPYFWGRIAFVAVGGDFITRTIATAAVVAAAFALVEFATAVNVFTFIPGNSYLYRQWGTIQIRAGLPRAEGAFGHSIALGAVLAMSSSFVLATRIAIWQKVVALAVVGGAVALTFSRIGLVTFALTVALALLFMRNLGSRARVSIAALLVLAAASVVPLLGGVFSQAGEEAGGSANYRGDLVILLSQVQFLGGAAEWENRVVGDTYLGYFARSTDNALISILLRFGYLPTACLFAAYVFVIVLALSRRNANPATIAIAGQVPGLVSVAMITQYGMFLWFVVGLAVAWGAASVETGAVDKERAPFRKRSTVIA